MPDEHRIEIFMTKITFVIDKQLIINKYLSKMRRFEPLGTDIMFEVYPKASSQWLFIYLLNLLLINFYVSPFGNYVCLLNMKFGEVFRVWQEF